MTAVSDWPRAAPSRIDHTQPALDLDALIGGFRPLFKVLGPGQGQQHRVVDHHRLSGAGCHHQRHPRPNRVTHRNTGRPRPGDRRGDPNLNTVLATTVKHQKEFDRTVNNVEQLITGLKNEPTRWPRRPHTSAALPEHWPTCWARTGHCCTPPSDTSTVSCSRSTGTWRLSTTRYWPSCRTHTGPSAAWAASTATSSTSTCAISR